MTVLIFVACWLALAILIAPFVGRMLEEAAERTLGPQKGGRE